MCVYVYMYISLYLYMYMYMYMYNVYVRMHMFRALEVPVARPGRCFSEHVRLLLTVSLRRMKALATSQVKQLWHASQDLEVQGSESRAASREVQGSYGWLCLFGVLAGVLIKQEPYYIFAIRGLN